MDLALKSISGKPIFPIFGRICAVLVYGAFSAELSFNIMNITKESGEKSLSEKMHYFESF